MEIPSGWNKIDSKLTITKKCNDFKHAVSLVNEISDIAERHQHHPDIGIKNYNELTITTTSHDEAKLTEKDYQLATEINRVL